MTEAHCV